MLDGGESLVLFPQGSILGIEVDFKAGPFALAASLGRPILPVALTGGHRVWEHPYSPRLRYGQRLSLSVLPPVSPDELRALGVEGARIEIQRRLKARALDGGWRRRAASCPSATATGTATPTRSTRRFPSLHAEIARHRQAVSTAGDGAQANGFQPARTPA